MERKVRSRENKQNSRGVERTFDIGWKCVYKPGRGVRGMTALTNDVWAEPCVDKSSPENLEYPELLGQILKNISKFPKFNFVTSRLSENFQSLLIPEKCSDSKSSDSRRNFAFLPKQPFLELTPP